MAKLRTHRIKRIATPLFSFVAIIIVSVVSFTTLKNVVTPIINGEKDDLRTVFINYSIPEGIIPEKEDNDTFEKANIIDTNVEYRGNLYDDYKHGEQDWYKIYLPEGGEINYTLKTIDQKDDDSYWNVNLRSVANPDEILISDHIAGNCKEYVSGSYYKSAGEYYFEIESSNKHSKDPYRFIINYDDSLEEYIGTYEGPQGLVGLNLLVKTNDDYSNIEAWFNFYPHPTNPDTPCGRIKMTGNVVDVYDDGSARVEFYGDKWIDQPEGYSMINFTALFNKPKEIIICDDYQMNLIREDVLYSKEKTYTDRILEFNGHKYCIFTQAMSWGNAESFCSDIGGHLVSINSPEEQEFIQKIADNSNAVNLWTGGYLDENTWKWTDGSNFGYSNWDVDKPDNYQGVEGYIKFPCKDVNFEAWAAHRGKWDDVSLIADGISGDVPLYSFGFICEWNE